MRKSWRRMAIHLAGHPKNEVHEREDRGRIHDSSIQSWRRLNHRKMTVSVGRLRRLIDRRRIAIEKVLDHALVLARRHES